MVMISKKKFKQNKIKLLLPNVISITRVLLTICLNIILWKSFHDMIRIILINIMIYISDFSDGKLAKWLNAESKTGELFDSIAHIFYIVTSYILLISYNLISIYLLIMIIAEYAVFIITSHLVTNNTDNKLIFDGFGRILAGGFYIYPLLVYILFLNLSYDYFNMISLILQLILIIGTIMQIRQRKKLTYKSKPDGDLSNQELP